MSLLVGQIVLGRERKRRQQPERRRASVEVRDALARPLPLLVSALCADTTTYNQRCRRRRSLCPWEFLVCSGSVREGTIEYKTQERTWRLQKCGRIQGHGRLSDSPGRAVHADTPLSLPRPLDTYDTLPPRSRRHYPPGIPRVRGGQRHPKRLGYGRPQPSAAAQACPAAAAARATTTFRDLGAGPHSTVQTDAVDEAHERAQPAAWITA